jgi:uncharacterized protein
MRMSPEALVREGYSRYARRDFAGVFALLSPQIEIVQTSELPWGGRYTGLDGARAFFAALAQHTDAMPEPIAYIPAGNDVAVYGRLRGKARLTGKPIDLDIVHIWTVHDDRVVRFAAYIDTPAMRGALEPPDAPSASP